MCMISTGRIRNVPEMEFTSRNLKKLSGGFKLGFGERPDELSPLLNWFVNLFRGADSGLWAHRLSMW